MVDKTTEGAIQKRDIIVTQIINELGVTIETNAKLLIHCKKCKHWRNGHICMAWSRHGTIETKGDDFCSYGCREEE